MKRDHLDDLSIDWDKIISLKETGYKSVDLYQ
jgi:hypothetical protein